MSKKLMLIAAGALAALAFAAIPSVAAAAEWECETTGGAICGTFSGSNSKTTTLTQDPKVSGESTPTVQCTSNETSGEYTSKTTGSLLIHFHGCTSSGFACTSGTLSSGNIDTFALTFHNAMLESTASGKPTPGVLITPNATNGEFATFTCAGLFTAHVKGNGLLGDVTKACASETKAGEDITMDFTSVASGTQTWTQVETTGTKYDLTAVETGVFGGTTERTGSQDGEGSIHFGSATKLTCP